MTVKVSYYNNMMLPFIIYLNIHFRCSLNNKKLGNLYDFV